MPFQIFGSLSFPLTVRKQSEQIFATATLLFEKNKSTNIVSIKLISSIDKFAKLEEARRATYSEAIS